MTIPAQQDILARKMMFITLPIEALLDVLAGRITLKLPLEVPEDSKYAFYHIDEDKQILKIAVTNDKFDSKVFDSHIMEYRALLEINNNLDKDNTEDSLSDSCSGAGDTDRLV